MAQIKKGYLIDMDGVLMHGARMIQGADIFIRQLQEEERKFLILTNNPMYTTRDLAHRLQIIGLDIPQEQIFTSALATAMFLQKQRPNGKAYVIGEAGLTEAIHAAGYIMTDNDPDYVVLGETLAYNIDQITKAIRLINHCSKFIATNPDASGFTETGLAPACGAMAALIEKASGISPFFVGKPNSLMMRTALNYLGTHSENTIMVGDRMDTDIVSGINSGMDTILVLSGVTKREDLEKFPYLPTYIFNSVADIVTLKLD
jgi:NagD protein